MPDQADTTASTDRPLGTAELAGTAPSGDPVRPEETNAEPDSHAALFPASEARHMEESWHDVQASFVDEPRRAVEQADELVAAAMKRLAETFADERSRLETQWDKGDEVSTEDLRIALQRYRAFFGRLLSV